MRKFLLGFLLLLAFSVMVNAQTAPKPPSTHLKVGDTAPDFALTDTEGKAVKLCDYKGKKAVVLAFYVLAFTGG
jgi:peroxiredoxin Q/BCP